MNFLKKEEGDYDEANVVRCSAIKALGELGDKRAIECLRAFLKKGDYSSDLISALEKLAYIPDSGKEQVYYWLAKNDTENIEKNWDRVRKQLFEDLRSDDHILKEHAFNALRYKEKKSIIKAQWEVGGLADLMLNSNDDDYRSEAEKWAKENGYQIMTFPGSYAPASPSAEF
jgi:hypothetical protein